MEIIILDIETTGLVPKGATYEKDFMVFPYILSMGWKIIQTDMPDRSYEYIINQEGRIVPPEATRINGITQKMCDESKFDTFTTILQFMMDAQGADYIVGFNLYFDTSIVKANFLRLIHVNKKTPMEAFDRLTEILHKDKRIDVMRACHKLFGGKWPKLEEAYMKLFHEGFNAHSAKEDVEATDRILQELIRLKVIVLPEPNMITGSDIKSVVVEEEI